MTTEQTAQQLELAAQILRTGHPFEVRHDASDRWHASLGVNPAQAVLQNWHLRPVLAMPPDHYHIKPETPPFQLPPPPPGMQWHRTDGWQEGDLPHGMRPLVLDEASPPTDEIKRHYGWTTLNSPGDCPELPARPHTDHCRTRRPLIFTHAGKQWTYHRPGDPAPCDTDKLIHYLMVGDADCAPSSSTSPAYASDLRWNQANLAGDILGWRYADETKTDNETIQDFSDNEILQLRQLLNYFSPLVASLNKMGKL